MQGVQQVLVMGDILTSQEDQFQLEVARLRSEHEQRHQEAEENLKSAFAQVEKAKSEANHFKKEIGRAHV